MISMILEESWSGGKGVDLAFQHSFGVGEYFIRAEWRKANRADGDG
ncbi:MAG: hypothetical protein UT26_C0043G0010 [Microgenomates group bacterium GW2011_GWC1_39_12]|nr:MAG: hypothetical protein UT26_C0043G0010 [Microgenomates group bacterium GW2011_GWC1_39_12]